MLRRLPGSLFFLLLLSSTFIVTITLAASNSITCGLKRPKSINAVPQGSGNPKQCLFSIDSEKQSVATTWYAGWHGTDFPPQNISWSKYTQVTYAFATTTPDVNTVSLADSDQELLPVFVSLAHQNNVKAILTIGGWTGSQYFSTAVADETNRTAFVKTVLGLASQYNLDGIDFDWEYPNRQGIGCNTINSQDSSNFLAFLQALRAEPSGENLTLSAAVSLTPFIGQDGSPLDDVSQFSEVLDFITIMDYDVWGTWTPSGVGPNAPLNDTCAPTSEQEGSAVKAVASWIAAKFPASQIVLGVASYGHSFSVSPSAAIDGSTGQMAAYPPFDASNQPHGDAWDADAGVDQCGNPTPVGGIWDFWGLVQGGFLTSGGTPETGIDYRFDTCSQTPYVYNPNTQIMVSYDDAASFAAKGKFISDMNLAGFAMWEAGGDYNDILLNSIRQAIANSSSTGTTSGDC